MENFYDPALDPSLDPFSDAKTEGGRGSHFIRDDLAVKPMVYTPSWNGTFSVFRPFPCVDYQDRTRFYPYRFDPGGRNTFSPFFKYYPAALKVGKGSARTTFFWKAPEGKRALDPAATPLNILVDFIDASVRNGTERPGWAGLIRGRTGEGAAIDRTKWVCLFQGMLLFHNSKPTYKAPSGSDPGLPPRGMGDRPCFYMLAGGRVYGGADPRGSTSLAATVIKALCEEVPGYRGDPGDFEARFVNGDPVDPAGGRFLVTYQALPGNSADPRLEGQARPSWRNAGPAQSADDRKGYDHYWTADFRGNSAAFEPSEWPVLRNNWCKWEDTIRLTSFAEGAHLLAAEFGDSQNGAQLIIEAFRPVNPDWVPEDMDAIARDAMSLPVAMPGTRDRALPGHEGWRQAMPGPMAPPVPGLAPSPVRAPAVPASPALPAVPASPALPAVPASPAMPAVPASPALPASQPVIDADYEPATLTEAMASTSGLPLGLAAPAPVDTSTASGTFDPQAAVPAASPPAPAKRGALTPEEIARMAAQRFQR